MKVPFFGQITYKFSDKKISYYSVMGVVLGVVSGIALIIMTINSFKLRGQVPESYGLTFIVGFLFTVTGLGLGIKSRMEKEVYYFLSDIGITINVINLFYIIYVLGRGIMVL